MRWVVKLAAVTPLLILALAGCAGTSSSPGIATAEKGKTASPSASTGQADPLKFAQCMREHGVNMPDPQNGKTVIKGGPGDNQKTKVDAAQKACAKYSPGGGSGKGPSLSKADQAKLLKYAQCMRQHGVDMPDPDFSGGGVTMSVRGGNDAKVQAAQEACTKLMPAEMQDDSPGTGTFHGKSK